MSEDYEWAEFGAGYARRRAHSTDEWENLEADEVPDYVKAELQGERTLRAIRAGAQSPLGAPSGGLSARRAE